MTIQPLWRKKLDLAARSLMCCSQQSRTRRRGQRSANSLPALSLKPRCSQNRQRRGYRGLAFPAQQFVERDAIQGFALQQFGGDEVELVPVQAQHFPASTYARSRNFLTSSSTIL